MLSQKRFYNKITIIIIIIIIILWPANLESGCIKKGNVSSITFCGHNAHEGHNSYVMASPLTDNGCSKLLLLNSRYTIHPLSDGLYQ